MANGTSHDLPGPRTPAEPDDLRVTHACHVALLESALDAIVSMGADGIVLEWNPAAERTFGYAPRGRRHGSWPS